MAFLEVNKPEQATLGVWSMLAILYQTILCIIVSWLTLGCRLRPESTELAEVTLMKLLYFYDPDACGRVHFYNYTSYNNISGEGAAVVWPIANPLAKQFRSKIQIWLALHIMWTLLGVVNISQGSRPYGFYVTLLPFSVIGLSILIVDLVFCMMFLIDIPHTNTEHAILGYINSKEGNLRSINTTLQIPNKPEDTSWIAVMMAYCSIRGIVQWIINFWIVKDSYFNGLVLLRRFTDMNVKTRMRMKSVQLNI